jgi:hypothetical protein
MNDSCLRLLVATNTHMPVAISFKGGHCPVFAGSLY